MSSYVKYNVAVSEIRVQTVFSLSLVWNHQCYIFSMGVAQGVITMGYQLTLLGP